MEEIIKVSAIKYPDSIESVVFSDNTVSIRCKCCFVSYDVLSSRKIRRPAPGRMTIQLYSPANKAICVRTVVRQDEIRARSVRQTILDPSSVGCPETNDDELIFRAGTLEARIPKTGKFRIRFYYCGLPLVSEPEYGIFCEEDDGCIRTGASLEISYDEYVYGLGRCGVSLARNGDCVEGGNPVYFSSHNYGIFVNTSKKTKIDIGSTGTCSTFSVAGSSMEYLLFGDDSMTDLLTDYAQFTGAMHIPEVLTQGVALRFNGNFSITSDYLISLVRTYKNLGLSLREVWLGNSWHPEYNCTGFTWDLLRFPNPDALLRAMHDAGTRLGLSVTPVISDASPEYTELLDSGYLVSTENNRAIVKETDSGNLGIVNVVILTARNWFTNKCDVLLKSQCDMLEADIPDFLLKLIEDRTGNPDFALAFPESLNIAIAECEIRARGRGSLLAITCNNRPGDHIVPYPNVSSGSSTSFASLNEIFCNSLSLGLSGYPAVNIDIPSRSSCGGNLFQRRLQLAMFSPHFRINVTTSEADPGSQNSIIGAVRTAESLRYGMMPYIYSSIIEGAVCGVPVMRMLSSVFPNDVFARGNQTEYMFGNSLLISPVLSEDGSCKTYIPTGVWTDLFTHERIQGPRYINRIVDSETVPMYARPNSIIATRTPESSNFRFFLDNVTFTCFELSDGSSAECEVYEDGAGTSGLVSISRAGLKITVRTKGFGQNKRVLLSGITNVVSVSESIPQKSEYGTMINFESSELIISLG